MKSMGKLTLIGRQKLTNAVSKLNYDAEMFKVITIVLNNYANIVELKETETLTPERNIKSSLYKTKRKWMLGNIANENRSILSNHIS